MSSAKARVQCQEFVTSPPPSHGPSRAQWEPVTLIGAGVDSVDTQGQWRLTATDLMTEPTGNEL